jgi:hypothetical protein
MKITKRLYLSILCLAVLLAGCAPPGFDPGAQLPNTVLSDRIRTQAVATAYTMLTVQASKAAPGTAATATPEMAPSATEPAPSATPRASATPDSPIVKPTSSLLAAADYPTYTSTPAQTDYTCSVVEIEPEAGKTFKTTTDFDLAVRIKNTGSLGWDAGKILLMYTSGQKMQTKTSAVVLTSQVDVDGDFVFRVDMQAPDAPGTYKTTWALASGPLFFCPVHFQVVVTK